MHADQPKGRPDRLALIFVATPWAIIAHGEIVALLKAGLAKP